MRVSIIIPVHNGEGELSECLSAVQASAVPESEILVVDDASTDGSAAVAERFGVEVLRLPENRGPAEARNQGAARARGELLFFLDADVVLAPGVVARAVEILESTPEIAAIFGSYDDAPRATGMVSRYRNLLHHYVHHSGAAEASTFWAACGAVRRSVFREVGGFDAARYRHASIEDIDLGYRIRRAGYRIRLDPRLQGKHLKRWTLASMVRTDVFRRALPWSKLILASGTSPNDLNLRSDQKACVALVGLACLLAAGSVLRPELLAGAVLALAGVVYLNRAWLGFLARRGGLAFALGCIPLHFLYFACSGAGYALAWADFRLLGPFGWSSVRSGLSGEAS